MLFSVGPLLLHQPRARVPGLADLLAGDVIAVLELIETEPLIKAVFASHLHFCDEAEAFGKPQFVNEPCYLGSVREIELI